MAKGPSYFSPDRYPERTRERFAYVLKRMQEDKVAGAEEINPGVTGVPRIVPYERPRREAGFHFVDHLLREAKTLVGMQSLTSESYTVRSTINAKLQRATEAALQDGLARYEAGSDRAPDSSGPELNLGEIIMRVTTEQSTRALRRGRVVKPVWQIALQSARLPLYDVHWPAAVVLSNGGKGADQGRPERWPDRAAFGAGACRAGALHVNDVIYVNIVEGKNRNDAQRRAAHPPQGARRGGGAGEQDRPHPRHGRRLLLSAEPAQPHQPGAAAARLLDQAAHLSRGAAQGLAAQHAGAGRSRSPCRRSPASATHYWTPKNYDGSSWGSMTLRRALENSKNLVTARLLDGGIDKDPTKSLEQICDLALEAQDLSRVHARTIRSCSAPRRCG